jgi:maltoporin
MSELWETAQATENLYSAFLQQAGAKKIGTYFGVRAEWWIF